MSFKRQVCDQGTLYNLKRRRVGDLLVEDISENEARIEKNGRVLCLVCHHKPILDTIQALALHRKGKKHIYCKEKRDLEKHELRELQRKRDHEHFTKHGKLPLNEVPGMPTAVKPLGSIPYDPRSKKTGRKERLTMETDDEPYGETFLSVKKTPLSTLPGYSSDRNLQYRDESPQVDDSVVEHDCSPGKVPSSKLARNDTQTIRDFVRQKKFETVNEPILIRPYDVKHWVLRKQFQNTETCLRNLGKSKVGFPQTEREASQTSTPAVPQDPDKKVKKSNASSVGRQLISTACSRIHPSSSWTMETQNIHVEKASNKMKQSLATQEGSSNSQQQQLQGDSGRLQAGLKYLQAVRSGWIKDRSGNWVKDPDAEFDSDEEPPCL